MQSPKTLNQYKKIEQKVDELSQALKEAADVGLNVSVIQASEQWVLPNGSKWPYGSIDQPEVKIQGYGYTYPEKKD